MLAMARGAKLCLLRDVIGREALPLAQQDTSNKRGARRQIAQWHSLKLPWPSRSAQDGYEKDGAQNAPSSRCNRGGETINRP